MSATTRTLRQQWGIANARQKREQELAPIRAEIAILVSEVELNRAKPVIQSAIPFIYVSRANGLWQKRIAKRACAMIVAELKAMPVQGHLPLNSPGPQTQSGAKE